MRNDDEFERWLDRELQRAIRPQRGPRPRAAQSAYRAAYRAGGLWPTRPRGVASSTGKAAVGIVVATLALGGGMKAATATTGSTDPLVWSHSVVEEAGAIQGPNRVISRTVDANAAPRPATPIPTPTHGPAQNHKRDHKQTNGHSPCPGDVAKADHDSCNQGDDEKEADHGSQPSPSPK